MAATAKLRLLDLFSGIGGFSFSLAPVAKTVAYCDISPDCRDILKMNMHRGALHRAPIFEDIASITSRDLSKLKPNTITAGFPCTDISSANPGGEGLKGERSGLFRQILRIVDACDTIKCVFLENSPRIKFKGLYALKRAMTKRGFEIHYTYIEAADLGAHHKRKRWYCLCYKPEMSTVLKSLAAVSPPSKLLRLWDRPKLAGPRVLPFKTKGQRDLMRRRCATLGNSVVPHVVCEAWNTLVSQEKEYEPFVESKSLGLKRRAPLHLVFQDDYHKTTRNYWATPVYSTWHNYSKITYRGIGLLSNQLYYETSTRISGSSKNKKYKEYTANPNFVEWLMGYPKDWTKLSRRHGAPRQ